MPERFRCAVASRAADEPLHGTASRVRSWLLLEQPGPWGRNALIESRLDRQVGMTLRSASRRSGVRVLLVRRLGWHDQPEGPRRVYLAHSGPQQSWIEQLDVADPGDVLRIDLDALTRDEPPGLGAPGPRSVHLVCTNGKHDSCCADFGRPVVRALADAGVPEVWESSHVGGDRFAANIVCLPHGVYFGRVEPDEAWALLDGFDRGELALDHYRGRSCFPPLVQSAEIFIRRELGEARLDGVRFAGGRRIDPDQVVARFSVGDRTLSATVRRELAEPSQLTCAAEGPGSPWRYHLVSIED